MKTTTFSEVPVNGEFFDPISNEKFRKINSAEATMITGEEAGQYSDDEFEPNEKVLVEEPALA
ncbi:hypothetical protein ACI2KR_09330 [Pseudomonas luteola]